MKFINDSDKRIPPNSTDKDGQPLKKPVPITVHIKKAAFGGPKFVKPGEVVEIPEEYARPRRGDGGNRIPSAIECVCPHLRPADPDECAAWEKTPAPPKQVRRLLGDNSIPSVEELIARGMSPGAARAKVSALLAEKSLAEQEAEGE